MRMNDDMEATSSESERDFSNNGSQKIGMFENQKDKFLSGIDSLTSAIHQARDSIADESKDSKIVHYADMLETNLNEFKTWVNDLTVDKAIQTTRDFARRRPEVLLVGLFGAGLAIGRILKSSGSSMSYGGSEFQSGSTVPPYATQKPEVH